MNKSHQKVVQCLDEAHAGEQALARVLQSQIAVTPAGSYRVGLERHLDETRDHAARVGARLEELGQGSNPLEPVLRLVESMLDQTLALGKAPFDLLRGSGGEETVLRNAKDACASEALEIATYTAIEGLARSAGDDQTAKLAASIRAEEEIMLDRIMREIPGLTEAVVGADVNGEHAHDVTTSDVADSSREPAEASPETARKTTAAPKRGARKTTAALMRNGGEARKPAGDAQADEQVNAAVASVASDADDELQAAAAAGDGAAAFTLWQRLRDTDFAAAEGWLRTSAELGDVRAAYQLGMLLWDRRDVDNAEAMLRNSTADPQGAYALGLLLYRERSDPQAAVEWLDRAAQADDPAAQRDLGIVLRDHRDLDGAHYWLSRAAERDDEARQALAQLAE